MKIIFKNKMKFSIAKIFILTFTFLALSAPAALAADPIKPATIPCVPGLPCIQQTTQEDSKAVRSYIFGTFGGGFLKITLGLVAALSVIFIVIGGMQMHLAFGNEEAISKAKKTLIAAIAGLILAILAVAIVKIVSNLPF